MPLRDAHSAFFRGLAAAHDPDGPAATRAERPLLLDLEHDNLRAALASSLDAAPDDALQLAVSLWRFWLARGALRRGSSTG